MRMMVPTLMLMRDDADEDDEDPANPTSANTYITAADVMMQAFGQPVPSLPRFCNLNP
jgi:hypothetical protein